MRKHYFICLFLLIFLNSCIDSSEEYEKNLDDFLGEWILQQMSYTNDSDEPVTFENASSSIIFTECNISNAEGNNEKEGILVVEGDSIKFTYQFDFYQDYINIDIERTKIENKPLYTFGKVQVNYFELIGENKLLFSSDYELVYPTNEKLTAPSYIYAK